MFTVCPKCALTLVVTAADLRVAQGYVRCGRCSSVFNALAQLSDERGATRAAGTAPPEPGPEEPAPSEEAISADALEFDPETTDAASVFVAAQPDPEWTAATGSFKSLVAANQEPVKPEAGPEAGGAGEDFDVELDAALLSDIVQSEPGTAQPGPAVMPTRSVTPPRADADGDVEPQVAVDQYSVLEPRATLQAVRDPLLWGVGAVLLALVLVAQIINHERDALAADPRFNPLLTALYSALGVPLAPRWDLHAYDVHQLGATVEPASHGAITVRASIHNAGARPQPMPLLRVTLQDRFGNRLASRDVQPRDYLPPGIAPAALLARDQRIDAELAFVDPGASAVGFELDACLPLAGGRIACANDASAR